MADLPDAIRQDHSARIRRTDTERAEIEAQVAEYLSRGGTITHVPVGVGEYQTLTITEREQRKRARLRGRVLGE